MSVARDWYVCRISVLWIYDDSREIWWGWLVVAADYREDYSESEWEVALKATIEVYKIARYASLICGRCWWGTKTAAAVRGMCLRCSS